MRHLYDILDRRNYAKLVNALGGSRVWIPKTGNLGHRDRRYFSSRDARILRLRSKGKSISALSRLFGLSPKRIYRIVGGRKFRQVRQRRLNAA
jgi:Mor family transcriptional regulator